MKDTFQNNAITSFPDIVKVVFKPIEKSFLNVILIHVFLIFSGLFTLAFSVLYVNTEELGISSFWVYLLLIALFINIILIKVLGYNKRKYVVRQKDISYKEGLFFRSTTTVPFNRIQHVEIDQGPISRFFNLVSLSVFTAGDSSDDLKVSGLLKEDAEQIKEYISTQIDE